MTVEKVFGKDKLFFSTYKRLMEKKFELEETSAKLYRTIHKMKGERLALSRKISDTETALRKLFNRPKIKQNEV